MTANAPALDRKSTRLNSSHTIISYAVFCLKKNDLLGDRRSDSSLIFIHPDGHGCVPRVCGGGTWRPLGHRVQGRLPNSIVFFFFINRAPREGLSPSPHRPASAF